MKILNKKLLRDLLKFRGQCIAISVVIMCGVMSLVCILSAHRGLELTRDTYYASYRLADFWIPLEKAPSSVLRRIEDVPGVTRAEGRIVKDVNLDIEGKADQPLSQQINSRLLQDHFAALV